MFIRWVEIPVFQTGYDIVMPCGFLVGFQETRIHLRTHNGCHLSTFGSGRDKYKQRQFKTYFELIFMLLTIEQTNQLLLKNHDLRPAGAKAIPEANANENRNTSRFRGRGRRLRCGSQRGSGRPAHNNKNPNKKMLMPQIRTKARSLCKNITMTIPATDVA